MPDLETVPAELAWALNHFGDTLALVDGRTSLSYAQLGLCVMRLRAHFPARGPVAVFGKPSAMFGAAVTACVVAGRPFVHLDPAMPTDVLTNIIRELDIDVVLLCDDPAPDQLPRDCVFVTVSTALSASVDDQEQQVVAGRVAADDIIYLVATSGTTGKPKCIPVTQDSAYLSYRWRDAYTPYAPGQMIGVYIFAIWEMFRPLRNGATVCFPLFSELMNPRDLVAFWQRYDVTEMLFTPSALEKTLQALPVSATQDVPLRRIILNGEVVSPDLTAAVREKLSRATLWNLYSICETHDIAMTNVSDRIGPAASVGVPMPYLKAVVLDDLDRVCPVGQPGLLHFEGPRMLGPGYINRPEETALRFRDLTLEGRAARLYDTGDQGFVDADGAVHVLGRIAHMLKLRGHSIQTRDLMDSLRGYVGFTQALPWIQDTAGQGKALVFYYVADAAQADRNAQEWGLAGGEARMPAALSKALRAELPSYCVPSYLVQLDEMPINAVSGKYDYKRLPKIMGAATNAQAASAALPTVAQSAQIIGCAVADLDPLLSFNDQGGDSLMAVNLLLALEEAYGCRVDFDFALNVPLGRLHEILSSPLTAPQQHTLFDRKGILLTGATGFLGSRVLAAAVRHLPSDHVVYCVVREKRNAPADRLLTAAASQGVDPSRVVLIPASVEDAQFGLDAASYRSLAACVASVIHCAAMVNLAVDRDLMQSWARAELANVLQFCRDADAYLRFTSSSAVFPDTGGPHVEGPTAGFEGWSGYGAAKVEAEEQIAQSGVPAALVRLPSLYDLRDPNPKDIYEIILTACAQMGAVPAGITFRMVDVHAAADFVVALPMGAGTRYFNFAPEVYVTPAVIPDAIRVLPLQTWLRDAPLSEAERDLIAADTTVLHATSRFECLAAETVWKAMTGKPLSTSSDPAALVERRLLVTADFGA